MATANLSSRFKRAPKAWCTRLAAAFGSSLLVVCTAYAEQPPTPCHPNPLAEQDQKQVRTRGDVHFLPAALQNTLERLASRPHSVLPVQAYAEAASPSKLFQYYLLDTAGFEPNVFTRRITGVNDTAQLTATGAKCGLPAIGAVRLVVEPKLGLPTNPNNIRAFIDIFTDIDGLFVINNESGWYEGWMIHDLVVAPIAQPRPDGHAQFGMILAADGSALAAMGTGHNIPGHIFTMDGNAVHLPGENDHFPDMQTNVVPIQLSMGAYNCMQQSDCHAYWEFNYTTNWVHPLYELPFTGGIPGTFEAGQLGALSSIVPGPGPSGAQNSPITYGDNPNTAGAQQGAGPRDPDKFEGAIDNQREFRQRFIPSGLAHEIYLDVYERPVSFEPGVPFPRRLYDAYAAEVARVGHNGVVSAVEGDVDTASDGFTNNNRLYLPATSFGRFAETREINDGLLAPRFAPSQRAWVLTGKRVPLSRTVAASAGRDSDDR